MAPDVGRPQWQEAQVCVMTASECRHGVFLRDYCGKCDADWQGARGLTKYEVFTSGITLGSHGRVRAGWLVLAALLGLAAGLLVGVAR
jgi:transposase